MNRIMNALHLRTSNDCINHGSRIHLVAIASPLVGALTINVGAAPWVLPIGTSGIQTPPGQGASFASWKYDSAADHGKATVVWDLS